MFLLLSGGRCSATITEKSCHREEWPWPDDLLVFELHDLGGPRGLHDPHSQVQARRSEQSPGKFKLGSR